MKIISTDKYMAVDLGNGDYTLTENSKTHIYHGKKEGLLDDIDPSIPYDSKNLHIERIFDLRPIEQGEESE